MIVGSVVSATSGGLGVLARSLYSAGVIDRVLIAPTLQRQPHVEWFDDAPLFHENRIATFFQDLDALLVLETAVTWELVAEARRRGVVTTLMPMYECTPRPLPEPVDRFLCPSALDLEHYRYEGCAHYLPVPVDVPWRRRTRARLFIHNAGNSHGYFRNGTLELLAALPETKAPLKLIIRSQEPYWKTAIFDDRIAEARQTLDRYGNDPRVEFVDGEVPYDELWKEGDVFVFPERFNGLSLPLQEAFASGMLVMGADRFPVNTWLPRPPLIPVSGWSWTVPLGIPIRQSTIRSAEIARCLDQWYGADISEFNLAGRTWAQRHCWRNWRQSYREFIGKGVV